MKLCPVLPVDVPLPLPFRFIGIMGRRVGVGKRLRAAMPQTANVRRAVKSLCGLPASGSRGLQHSFGSVILEALLVADILSQDV